MLKIQNLHNWIAELPEELSSAILGRMVQRQFQESDEIYANGEDSNGFYLIESGTVRISNYTPTGKEFILIDFYENECFGELGVIDKIPRVTRAYCVTKVSTKFLSKKIFWEYYETHPEIAKVLNLFLCRRLRLLLTLTQDASGLNLKERLVRLLLRLATSRGGPDDDAVWLPGISHEILANRLGATRQAVSKELKLLENESMVKLHYGKLAVTGLWAYANEYEILMGGESIVPDYQR